MSLERVGFITVPTGQKRGFDHADTYRSGCRIGPHPNGLAYDSNRRSLYALNLGKPLGENCTASVVDVDSLQVVAAIPLPGRPRWAVYDAERETVYANIRAPARIAMIDCNKLTITRALDAIGDPGVVCTFDSDRLDLLEAVATEPGAHTVGWDPDGRSLYVFCPRSGGAAVYEERV